LGGVDGAPAGSPVGSEDCLYLNVWAPRFQPEAIPSGEKRLPVMVWIHGGGNTIGEAGFYNGGNLAATHDLVVVSINYRLGPFGWFRHASLRSAADAAEASGNFGTLDLIHALHWVRDHIDAFGGDPDNVTIFGESAGGQNVFTLLLSPAADGLFHRAIVQSGGLWMSDVVEAENLVDDTQPGSKVSSNEVLLRLLIEDERAAGREAAKGRLAVMSSAETAAYLRGKSNFEILGTYQQDPGSGMIDMPKVFPDGTVLPDDDPMRRLSRADGYNVVPVMLGTTRDENKLFMYFDPRHVQHVLGVFPRLRNEREYNLIAEYLARMWKATGADQPAAAMRAAQGPSVYVYRFDWDEEPTILFADASTMVGAAHGFEIPFVFGHFDLGPEGNIIFSDGNAAGRRSLAVQMMSYWAEFAYNGAPGRGRFGELPEWTAWQNGDAVRPRFMVLDTAADGGVRMSSEALTVADVLAAVDDDPRLRDQQERCTIFRELATHSDALDRDSYASAGREGCGEYSFDGYPWGG
jgi:para-nitrobenzyl esterase